MLKKNLYFDSDILGMKIKLPFLNSEYLQNLKQQFKSFQLID